jgi:hypothetical protein
MLLDPLIDLRNSVDEVVCYRLMYFLILACPYAVSCLFCCSKLFCLLTLFIFMIIDLVYIYVGSIVLFCKQLF